MNGKTELLPCPFCGGEAEMLTAESMNGGYLFGIMCNDCRSRGDVYDTEAEAIAAWNACAERGTLTAEQVRETVEKHWHDLSADYDMPEATALPEYSYDWQAIADELNATLRSEINGDTSDGYHTFNELYHHRAVLFSVVVAANSGRAWKSKLHHDGTMYDGMFIVGVDTPQGQATYHYDVEPYWDMFWCRELERAPEWDGHTPDDAIERIGLLRDVVFKGPMGRR